MVVKLITDSTSDIEPEVLRKLDIRVIPLSIHFSDESFLENQVSREYFYQKLKRSATIPSSSQPSRGDIIQIFFEVVEQGNDVLAIFLSSGISGTYENALQARNAVLEKYPHAHIEIIDSLNTSMALGLIVMESASAAAEGKTLQEVADIAREMVRKVRFYFIPESLEYLRKGGRIGGAAALLGNILHIKPILCYMQGRTAIKKKVRCSKGAIAQMLTIMKTDFYNNGLKYIVVQHIDNESKARDLQNDLQKEYGVEVQCSSVGPVVGMHVGPGTIGITYCLHNFIK